MALFEKKFCDFCGNKIGMLGNKKFEDGNMCKDCAAKLSPWFNERKHSSKADLEAQLQYREQNRQAVAAFQTTRTIGNHTKLLIDDMARKFMVTSAANLMERNPDVLDFSQASGCSLEIQESRNELKRKDKDGKSVSYNPPRYEYSYNFYVTIHVNTPYFNEMRYSLSNGYVKTGEQPMNTMAGSWNMHSSMIGMRTGVDRYNEYIALGNEIKEAVDDMRMGGMPTGQTFQQGYTQPQYQQQGMPVQPGGIMQQQAVAQPQFTQQPMMQGQGFAATQMMPQFVQSTQQIPASVCPHCSAPVTPGARFCESCGGQL